MPSDLPTLHDGDLLEPWHLNVIYAELKRWRKLRGVTPIAVNGADSDAAPTLHIDITPPMFARLTGVYAAGYPWEEVSISAGRVIATTGLTGNAATGNAAFEIQTGDVTLTADGTIYEFRRSPCSGEWVFDGKN
jgi:hypothetical protein